MKNFRGVWICRFDETVVGPLAIATCGDDSSALEVREMAGNFRLICLQNLNAVADA